MNLIASRTEVSNVFPIQESLFVQYVGDMENIYAMR